MILIVGLGNPGEKYQKTRHNLGFIILDKLARALLPLDKTKWKESKKFNSELLTPNSQLILAQPQTFMNASGMAVAKIANYYKITPENIWVVHDEVDLPLGRLKIRLGGAAAGHRGVESVIKELGTDKFVRFRVGTGHPSRGADGNVERYVLKDFDVNEQTQVKQLIKKTVKAIRLALEQGLERAMNEFNS